MEKKLRMVHQVSCAWFALTHISSVWAVEPQLSAVSCCIIPGREQQYRYSSYSTALESWLLADVWYLILLHLDMPPSRPPAARYARNPRVRLESRKTFLERSSSVRIQYPGVGIVRKYVRSTKRSRCDKRNIDIHAAKICWRSATTARIPRHQGSGTPAYEM